MWFGLIFTGIFFIGIALLGIISKLRQLRYFRKHCTVPLIAEIIRYDKHMRHYRGRDYKYYHPVYRYEYEGRTIITEGLEIHTDRRIVHEFCEISVDPAEPSFVFDVRNIVYRDIPKSILILLPILILGVVILLIPVFME